jgi:hypothetical protein
MRTTNIFFICLLALISGLAVMCRETRIDPTIETSDCKAEDVDFVVNAEVEQIQGTNNAQEYVYTIQVQVLCKNEPLPEAEIKVDPPYGNPVTLTTDENGKTTPFRSRRISEDPTGKEYTVTIEGSDFEEKTETFRLE